MNITLIIILAIILDSWLGEPQKHHPLVFFGLKASSIEETLNQRGYSANKQKALGVLALILMVVPFTALIFFIVQWNWIYNAFAPVILYFCIANKSLKQHASAVFEALINNDLSLSKKRVSMIVSRQTDKMNNDDIRKATIESVLENGADAVFAPIFWFLIAGPAGAIMYRLSNTMDAMWGYKNQRYIHFGWAAAKLDDLLNWAPARLTALSYALLGNTKQAFQCWKNQAHLLDSPNAGPVMTSGAGSLSILLGGPAWYHDKLKDKIFFGAKKNPGNEDIIRANTLITYSLYLWVSVIAVLQFVIYQLL